MDLKKKLKEKRKPARPDWRMTFGLACFFISAIGLLFIAMKASSGRAQREPVVAAEMKEAQELAQKWHRQSLYNPSGARITKDLLDLKIKENQLNPVEVYKTIRNQAPGEMEREETKLNERIAIGIIIAIIAIGVFGLYCVYLSIRLALVRGYPWVLAIVACFFLTPYLAALLIYFLPPQPGHSGFNERTPCPECGEYIMHTASICRFCNAILSGQDRTRMRKT